MTTLFSGDPRGLLTCAALLSLMPLRGATAQHVTALPPVDSSILRRLEALATPPYQAAWRSSDGGSLVGRERFAVLISYRNCIGARDSRFKPALRAALRLLAQQARRDSVGFSATGVSIDWEPDSGVVYLSQLADFDQWVVGRNWLNDDVVQFVWQDSTAAPLMPQLIVFEREVRQEVRPQGQPGSGLAFTPAHILHRLVGAATLARWVLATADTIKGQ